MDNSTTTSKKPTLNIKRKKKDDESTHIIKTVKTMKEKGDIYENYIKDYLQSQDKKRLVWLWENIPEDVMCNVGIFFQRIC